MTVHDVAHSGIEDGVAQKFKALVVDRLTLGVALKHALVHKCQLIQRDVVGINANDFV